MRKKVRRFIGTFVFAALLGASYVVAGAEESLTAAEQEAPAEELEDAEAEAPAEKLEDAEAEEATEDSEDAEAKEPAEDSEGAEAEEETGGEKLLSVELPVVSESGESPLDFILDPQGLINATDAAHYGGRTFEEGATLYFENGDGKYDFSSVSDFLTVTNKSTATVQVNVSAYAENISKISMSEDLDFDDSEVCLYLALIDDRGREAVFDGDGRAELTYEIAGQEDGESAEYSFALTGACNSAADWSSVRDKPHITIKWTVELLDEETEIEEDVEEMEEVEEAGEETEAGESAEALGETEAEESAEALGETEAEESAEALEETEAGESAETAGEAEAGETVETEETETEEEETAGEESEAEKKAEETGTESEAEEAGEETEAGESGEAAEELNAEKETETLAEN